MAVQQPGSTAITYACRQELAELGLVEIGGGSCCSSLRVAWNRRHLRRGLRRCPASFVTSWLISERPLRWLLRDGVEYAGFSVSAVVRGR